MRYDTNAASPLHPEVLTQIDLLDLIIFKDTFWFALGNDLAFVDDVGPLADRKGLPNVVIGDQNTYTLIR